MSKLLRCDLIFDICAAFLCKQSQNGSHRLLELIVGIVIKSVINKTDCFPLRLLPNAWITTSVAMFGFGRFEAKCQFASESY
jgi:hypothetical protein